MSNDTMTLKERFDWHMGEAAKHDAFFVTSGGRSDINLQRAQLHATLAQAIATRMVAIETAELALHQTMRHG